VSDVFAKVRGAWARFDGLIRSINRIPGRLTLMERNITQIWVALDTHVREARLKFDEMSLPPEVQWRNQPPLLDGTPADQAFPNSTLCRQESFQQPYFSYWTIRLGQGLRYHRKLWEFVFIAQALWERGAVKPGTRALGFGVGEEPLTAFFASQDVAVTATDLDTAGAQASGWVATGQHAAGKAALRYPTICPDSLFDKNVEFRVCDMNAIAPDLRGYDFCWSACALEHLGSIEKGLAFIEKSIECLKPGGWAIHTTEFNTSSNLGTVDHMDTVLFRRMDFEALAARLTAQGHYVAPFDFETGNQPIDRYHDLPPYRAEPHLKVALAGYGATSAGIIIQRGP